MKIDKSLMTGSTTMLILSLLAGEEMYGYQMGSVKDFSQISLQSLE